MNGKPKTFQIIFLGSFVFMIILGFLAFSGKLPLPGNKKDINYGTVTLWGSVPQSVMVPIVGDVLKNQPVRIVYVEKKEKTIDEDLVEALASGTGPDMVILTQEKILKLLNKIRPIPYETVTQRDFKNSYIELAELFTQKDGIVAMPVAIDPLVMYWNRDIFTNAGVTTPPQSWSQFYELTKKITIRQSSGNITQSLVAFGTFSNINNAKSIISALFLQAGQPIVAPTGQGTFRASLNETTTGGASPAGDALVFYTEFARSDKSAYSWNRSLPSSRNAFEAGDLALYFGFASEYEGIRAKNPHLNFDVTTIPQKDQASKRMTLGNVYGAAILKNSKNPNGAVYAAQLLSTREATKVLSEGLGVAPVHRSTLAERTTDPIRSVVNDSAVIARSWYDPAPEDTDLLFANMIENINSGRHTTLQALNILESNMQNLIR